jgi:polynucleotide 5'-kinase involved in rRNA processing
MVFNIDENDLNVNGRGDVGTFTRLQIGRLKVKEEESREKRIENREQV